MVQGWIPGKVTISERPQALDESAEEKVLGLPLDVTLEKHSPENCEHHLITMGVGGGEESLKRMSPKH